MKRIIRLALLAITLTLGCSGVAEAQGQNSKQDISEDPLISGLRAAQRKDFATAARLLQPLAEQGDVLAQFNLGLMYSKGDGVPQNYKEAARLYGLAAAQGNANAQNNLGLMYDQGVGVSQNVKAAARMYKLAAAQGVAQAQNNLGVMYEKGAGVKQDYMRAHMWYNLAATSGASKAASINRNKVSAEMLPKQIAIAQAMALICQASKFKHCD